MASASQKATLSSCCSPPDSASISRRSAPVAASANAVPDWADRAEDQRVKKVAMASLIRPVDSLSESSTQAPTIKGSAFVTALILL